MANFLTVQTKAKNIKLSQVRKELFNFIRSIDQELIAYNVATLNQDSQDVYGKAIGFYSRGTEVITNGRKKTGEPFDLEETGTFLDSIFVKVQGNSILFDNSDPKKKEVLQNLLTEDVFGLQDVDLYKVVDERLLPFLLNYYKSKLL